MCDVDVGEASSVSGVCVEDVAVGGGSDVGGAYKAEANAKVDGVCSNSDLDVELHVAHRGTEVKARWCFSAIVTCNINKH